MMRKYLLVFGVILLAHLTSTSFADERPLQQHKENGFIFFYPDGWQVVLDRKIDNMRLVKLTGEKNQDQIDILFSFSDQLSTEEIKDAKQNKMPVLLSLAFGMGTALKLAGECGESCIATTYGSIRLSKGSTLSTVFTIMPPGKKGDSVQFLESFSQLYENKKKMLAGNIVRGSSRGGGNTRPSYCQLTQEAYEIVQSASVEY